MHTCSLNISSCFNMAIFMYSLSEKPENFSIIHLMYSIVLDQQALDRSTSGCRMKERAQRNGELKQGRNSLGELENKYYILNKRIFILFVRLFYQTSVCHYVRATRIIFLLSHTKKYAKIKYLRRHGITFIS